MREDRVAVDASAAELQRERDRSSRGAAQLNAARRAQESPALATPRVAG